ncbi:MAG: hypothetical protein FWH15_08945 [Betaproteobacteria bacterium]|nr:hypothetical protein [Betaproteobacteria bacterium]
MLAATHTHRSAILVSLILTIVAIPTAALAAEIDVLQRQCERETEAFERNKRGSTISCAQLDKLLRDKAYKDRGERPPKEDRGKEDVIYVDDRYPGGGGGGYCIDKQTRWTVPCP